MPERSSKRNARRESITSSVDETECSSMRTGNVPSISDKEFADLTEKIEKSVNKRIKDTETGQREILKMIEYWSSKIDSLTDKTYCDLNQGLNGVNSENVILETRPIELNKFRQEVSQHMVTGVSPQTETPPGHQACHLPQPEIPGPRSRQTARIASECHQTEHRTSQTTEGIINNYAHLQWTK